jgi:DinB superfamily
VLGGDLFVSVVARLTYVCCMPLPSAADVLKVQLRHAWVNARRALEDLDEDAYLWEPTPLCWSVRRREPNVQGWGAGEFVCEDAWPPPEPLPVPTIAWRVIHLAAWTEVYLHWTFGDRRPRIDDFEVPGNAPAGLRWLYDAQDRFSSAVDALDDVSVFELRPAHWGESVPIVRLVTLMLTQHVHHIAEIGVLRDLRRGSARRQPPPPPTPGPQWWSGVPSRNAREPNRARS